MNYAVDSQNIKEKERSDVRQKIDCTPLNSQNKYDSIKKKAPLIKSKNTRYYFDPFFDYQLYLGPIRKSCVSFDD